MKNSILIPTVAVVGIVSFYYFSKPSVKEIKIDEKVESVSLSKEEYELLLGAKQGSKPQQEDALDNIAFIPVSSHTVGKQHSDVEFKSSESITTFPEQGAKSEVLVAWSKEYEKQLFDIVENNMSTHTADFMKLQLTKNSFLLNNRQLKQDSEEDANWAYLMEDNIRSAIEQHELKPDFDILSIKCKQLSCEIMGIERAVNTWHNIYVSLLSELPNAIFPDINDGSSSYSIKEGDVDYSFSNISFERS